MVGCVLEQACASGSTPSTVNGSRASIVAHAFEGDGRGSSESRESSQDRVVRGRSCERRSRACWTGDLGHGLIRDDRNPGSPRR